MWFIEDKIFDPEEHSYQNYAGFVYVITDLSNQKKYIGKKLFWKIEKKRPLKGKVNKKRPPIANKIANTMNPSINKILRPFDIFFEEILVINFNRKYKIVKMTNV